jgi:hypothetical protein
MLIPSLPAKFKCVRRLLFQDHAKKNGKTERTGKNQEILWTALKVW